MAGNRQLDVTPAPACWRRPSPRRRGGTLSSTPDRLGRAVGTRSSSQDAVLTPSPDRSSGSSGSPGEGRPGCRHRRRPGQQFPDPRLHRVDHQSPRRPLVLRRRVPLQRRLHRVLRAPQPRGDHLDRHPLTAVQPTNLGSVLDALHPPHDSGGGQFRTTPVGQFSPVADTERPRRTRRIGCARWSRRTPG